MHSTDFTLLRMLTPQSERLCRDATRRRYDAKVCCISSPENCNKFD